MQNLKTSLLNTSFSHIYIEKQALNHLNTKKILSNFKNSIKIEINHYKDVFCRSNQSFMLQKQTPNLILAVNKEKLVYKGSELCEDFDNENFFYTSSIMNCMYSCEYCYLQGMYQSANIVVFVNIEDIFKEVEKLLEKHPVYLCISYDSDLLSFENITSFVSKWFNFAKEHANLTIELRTKSANFKAIKHVDALENIILAWTLSPQAIIDEFEINTPSLEARLNSINEAIDNRWKVRLCFDPIIHTKEWKVQYKECIQKVFDFVCSEKIFDVSVGVFRIPKDYLKKIQKERKNSVIFSYPFECKDGVYSYSDNYKKQFLNFIYQNINEYVSAEKIYT